MKCFCGFQVTTNGLAPYFAKGTVFCIEIEDAKGFYRSVTVLMIQVCPWRDGAIADKDEIVVRVVLVGFEQNNRVIEAAPVLELTAGVFSVA